MKLGKLIVNGEALITICRRWNVAKIEAFGSVLRDDFGPESDVDLLVSFNSGTKPSFAELMALQDALEALLGRKVDLAQPQQLKWVIRDRVLAEAQVVYAL